MTNFTGPVTLPSGAAAAWHRLDRAALDFDASRIIVDISSWATELAARKGYAPEQQRVAVSLAALAGSDTFVGALKTALTTGDGPLAGAAETIEADSLDAAKAAKRAELSGAWLRATRAGVTIGGKVAPTDPGSWTRYLALKAMAEDTGTWIDVPIPLADGSFELMTKAKAVALWAALKGLERALLAKLRDKIEAVQAAATVAEIEAITWD